MRAVQVTTLDGPKAVQVVDVPEPDATGKVLVAVHAVGVNFPDVLQTRGEYQMKPELPFIPTPEIVEISRLPLTDHVPTARATPPAAPPPKPI